MRNEIIKKQELKNKRKLRVRKHLRGTSTKPRLCVVKTNKHMQAQLIDDQQGLTLASLGTFSKQFKGTEFSKKNKQSAEKIGTELAQLALNLGIKEIVFDRGSAKYHGILAAFADAAREKGLQF